MTPEEKAELAQVVEFLIEDPEAAALFRQMNGVYDLARKGVPVRLVGRAAALNPMIDLRIDDEPAAMRVIDLINRKRALHGREPIGEGDFNRRSYMRELMAQKRERGRRLVTLYNQLRSEKDKLSGTVRTEFERVHANRWLTVKTEREDAARDRLGRRLSADEMKEISQTLWAEVDRELDNLEIFVREESRKPLHARAKDGFKFLLQPKKG